VTLGATLSETLATFATYRRRVRTR
jgi:hypothetical protein